MSTQVAEKPQAAAAVPAAVEGVLNFAEPGAEKAYTYTYKPPEGVKGATSSSAARR